MGYNEEDYRYTPSDHLPQIFSDNPEDWNYVSFPTFPTIRGKIDFKKPVPIETWLEGRDSTPKEVLDVRAQFLDQGPNPKAIRMNFEDGVIVAEPNTSIINPSKEPIMRFIYNNEDYVKAATTDFKDADNVQTLIQQLAIIGGGAAAGVGTRRRNQQQLKNFQKQEEAENLLGYGDKWDSPFKLLFPPNTKRINFQEGSNIINQVWGTNRTEISPRSSSKYWYQDSNLALKKGGPFDPDKLDPNLLFTGSAPKPLWNENVPTPVVVNSENYDQVLGSLAKEYDYDYTNLKRAYRRRRNISPDLGTKYLNSAYMFNEKTGSLDGFPAIQLDNGVTLRPKAIDSKGGVKITLDTGGLRDMRSKIQNYGGTLTGEDSYSDIKGKFISFGGKRYTLTDFKKDIESGWELDNYLRMTFRGIEQLDPHHMDELAAGSILNQGLDPVQSMLVTAYKVEKGIFAGHSPFNMALLPHEVHVPLTTWMNRNVRDNMKALEQEILAIPTFEGRKPYIERYVAMFRAAEQKMFQFMQAYQIITDQPGTEALSPDQIADILGNLDDPELISLINQVNKTRTEKQGLMGFFGDVKESVYDMYDRIINNEAFPDPRFPTKTQDMEQEGRPKSVPKSG